MVDVAISLKDFSFSFFDRKEPNSFATDSRAKIAPFTYRGTVLPFRQFAGFPLDVLSAISLRPWYQTQNCRKFVMNEH